MSRARDELRVELVGCFEGFSLVTIERGGEPYWLADELAAILGWEDAAALLRGLGEAWGELDPEDARLLYLRDEPRAELKDKLARAHVVLDPEVGRARALVLLGRAAAEAATSLRESSTAKHLRSHLCERIIPEFFARERAAVALDRPILSADAARIAGNHLEFERRGFESAALGALLDRLEQEGAVDTDLLTAHRVVASELALGCYLDELREELDHGWSTPSQIAERWLGMTPMRVSNLIAHLGLKGSRAHSKAILNKARGHDRTVISYVYSPAAVALVERELRSRSYRRADSIED